MKKTAEESCVQHADSEHTPLLQGHDEGEKRWRRRCGWLAVRYRNTPKCVSSKAALLILFWSFLVGLISSVGLYPDLMINLLNYVSDKYIYTTPLACGCAAFLFLFSPLAGMLADIKYGRYKTVIRSLLLLVIGMLASVGVGIICSLLASEKIMNSDAGVITIATLAGIVGFIAVISFITGLIGFMANAIQFGMDQLHDSTGLSSYTGICGRTPLL